MVKKKLRIGRIIIAFIILIVIICLMGIGIVFYELSPMDKKGLETNYIVESGATLNSIYEDLENKKIIRSAFFMKIYTKILGNTNIEAGEYKLSPSMKASEIYDTLSGGGKSTRETFTLTFKEGRNIRDLSETIEKLTEGRITKDTFIEKLKDTSYLDDLINKYWFLTDEIKNKDIYYSLEGYLFPNTYELYKDATIEEIIAKMLDETGKQLDKYKTEIENSNYTVHELLTLASIVELESSDKSDRKDIAGVFTNRLDSKKWSSSLGSCVSTYYAFGINMGDRDLKMSEIEDCTSNKYNTRCTSMLGLPVGPIGNPGIVSIDASLNPNETDYYYFLSDKYGNTYFSKTEAEHDKKGRELRANGQMLYN